MLQRHGGDREFGAPKKNQRRAPDHGEDRRAEDGRHQQQDQGGFDQMFRGHRLLETGQHHQGHQADGRQSPPPAIGGVPDEPKSDQTESQWQDELHHPKGNAVCQFTRVLSLGADEVQARQQQIESHRRPGRMAEECGRHLHPAPQKMRQCRKGQQAAFAGGDGAPEHSDEQGEMLHEGDGPGDPGVERAEQHLEQRQHDQPAQTKHNHQVLRLPEEPAPSSGRSRRGRPRGIHAIRVQCVVDRYSWSSRLTSSKISAGTIVPRILG